MALPTTIKTPGVYINEKNAFPNSVVGVETAVPAFIGYTEKAKFKGKSLLNKPVRIDSMMEFQNFYGNGPKTKFQLNTVDSVSESPKNYDTYINEVGYKIKAKNDFKLYDSMKFFYQNGGGSCFIVSVGSYVDKDKNPSTIKKSELAAGIDLLEKEIVPTMLVIPDAILLKNTECYALQQKMLMHCGKLKNRVAILDVYDGDKPLKDATKPVDSFRNNISSEFLSYGAAYYPWLNTTIVQSSEVDYKNLNNESIQTLKTLCKATIANLEEDQKKVLVDHIDLLSSSNDDNIGAIHNALSIAIPDYKLVMDAILKKKNLLPPSAAMAGIFSLVDSQRGVWKAPANVAVSSVVSPAVLIDHHQQEDLNAPVLGKAICAIRPFIGLGTMVWGARTLDANSLDWRYINVRRTMIMMEQSIKFAAKAYVFEPNVKNTWVSVQAMIANFLTNLWKLGALAGAVPADAFSVNVGLGTTMTAVDILEGKMIIEVKVAVSRPAEFIVITFEQQMQKS